MTRSELLCDSYGRVTRNYDGDALDINRVRRWLQEHIGELDAARRAQLAAADQRLLALARAETDPCDQRDLWDALAYAGYAPEGPVRMD